MDIHARDLRLVGQGGEFGSPSGDYTVSIGGRAPLGPVTGEEKRKRRRGGGGGVWGDRSTVDSCAAHQERRRCGCGRAAAMNRNGLDATYTCTRLYLGSSRSTRRTSLCSAEGRRLLFRRVLLYPCLDMLELYDTRLLQLCCVVVRREHQVGVMPCERGGQAK